MAEIILTEGIIWDDTLSYDEQTEDAKQFVDNEISRPANSYGMRSAPDGRLDYEDFEFDSGSKYVHVVYGYTYPYAHPKGRIRTSSIKTVHQN